MADLLTNIRNKLANGLLGIDPEYDQPAMAALGGLLSGDVKAFTDISKMRLNNALSGGKDAQYAQMFPNAQPFDPISAGAGFAPTMALSTVYHGSPIAYNKSDIKPSIDGTYGKGVYLAEREGTAKVFGENIHKFDLPDTANLFDVYQKKLSDYKDIYKKAKVKMNPKIEEYLRLGAKTDAFRIAKRDLGDFDQFGYDGIKGYSEYGGNEFSIYNPKILKDKK
jgi:hypothetical protein